MRRAPLLACAVLLSCADQPSRLDRVTGADTEHPAKRDKPDRDTPRDPFDLRTMLAKVADAVGKPGPYEAPEASDDFDAQKPHWGVLDLGGEIVERQSFSLTGSHGTELRSLITRLRKLASNAKLTGLILRVEGIQISLPDAVELRAAFHEFRAAGKQLACHSENADNASYLLLAACDRIGLAPLGDVVISGPAAMPVHIKPLLDKLGIRADFLHVGAYKGAAEPLTRDAPSRETEETINAILDRRYQTMVEAIGADRKLDPAAARALIDTALFTSDEAKAAKLVDDVAAFEPFRAETTRSTAWTKLELDSDKGNPLAMITRISRFLGAAPPDQPTEPHVAVVYALGNIVDGDGDGVLGARHEIASRTMVAALRAITADDSVKAVVLRIDSGGGSAQASELIWRTVNELKAKKPIVVSMSDVAASGGYYIACGASKIFALDDTLTGSIGVVGGKLAPRDALARIGVNTFPMGRGKRATMAANLGPWSDDERQTIQTAMQAVYTTFVARVAEGRHQTPEQIQAIAQGRVWTGSKAKELGLVDEIGGLDAAIAEARTLAKVEAKTGLEVFPPAPTLRDVVSGFGQVQAPLGLSADAPRAALAELTALDPRVGAAARQLVDLVLSFRAQAVQTVAILPVLP